MKVISVELVAKWISTTPELSTRSNLLAKMVEDKKTRHLVFSVINGINNITAMADRKAASHVLEIYSDATKKRIHDFAENLSREEASELFGLVKNLLKMSHARLTNSVVQYSNRDVVRWRWYKFLPWRKIEEKTVYDVIANALDEVFMFNPALAEKLTASVWYSSVDREVEPFLIDDIEIKNGRAYCEMSILSVINQALAKVYNKDQAVSKILDMENRKLLGFEAVMV